LNTTRRLRPGWIRRVGLVEGKGKIMFSHTVRLKQEGDKYFIEVIPSGYGADIWREPDYMTRQECERLLKEKGYTFMYKSKVRDWEVWGKEQ
jgi:prolyl oligopeptidase PreP (S9A serine peptidase family)